MNCISLPSFRGSIIPTSINKFHNPCRSPPVGGLYSSLRNKYFPAPLHTRRVIYQNQIRIHLIMRINNDLFCHQFGDACLVQRLMHIVRSRERTAERLVSLLLDLMLFSLTLLFSAISFSLMISIAHSVGIYCSLSCSTSWPLSQRNH